jgi:pimeloyl-ACP methyl ester carboxylesterase
MTEGSANTLLFLPGASGNIDFWRPVASGLRHAGQRRFVAWPGFGDVPSELGVNGIDDLVARVVDSMSGPVDLLAQSMGSVIAIRAALHRPELVKHMVLAVTSGGLDVSTFGAQDWRPMFLEENPSVPRWFIDAGEDLTDRLGELSLPVLLLWGDADPISPVSVGRRLAALLPRAELVVLKGGTHDLVFDRANEVVPYIDKHLAA